MCTSKTPQRRNGSHCIPTAFGQFVHSPAPHNRIVHWAAGCCCGWNWVARLGDLQRLHVLLLVRQIFTSAAFTRPLPVFFGKSWRHHSTFYLVSSVSVHHSLLRLSQITGKRRLAGAHPVLELYTEFVREPELTEKQNLSFTSCSKQLPVTQYIKIVSRTHSWTLSR